MAAGIEPPKRIFDMVGGLMKGKKFLNHLVMSSILTILLMNMAWIKLGFFYLEKYPLEMMEIFQKKQSQIELTQIYRIILVI